MIIKRVYLHIGLESDVENIAKDGEESQKHHE